MQRCVPQEVVSKPDATTEAGRRSRGCATALPINIKWCITKLGAPPSWVGGKIDTIFGFCQGIRESIHIQLILFLFKMINIYQKLFNYQVVLYIIIIIYII